MNRLLTVCLLGSFAFAASAQDAVDSDADRDAQDRVEQSGEATSEAETNLDPRSRVQRDADRNCLRHTGSLIIRRDMREDDCVSANGRVYSREDLERTGAVDVADALRRLDPAIR